MPNPRVLENYKPDVDDSDSENGALRDFESSYVARIEEEGDEEQDNHRQQEQEQYDDSGDNTGIPAGMPTEITTTVVSMRQPSVAHRPLQHRPGSGRSVSSSSSVQRPSQSHQYPPPPSQQEHATRHVCISDGDNDQQQRSHRSSGPSLQRRSWLFWAFVAAVVLLLVLAAVAVAIMILTLNDDDGNGDNRNPAAAASFTTRDALVEAVDVYLNRGPDVAAARYGGPIETWQFGQVTDLSQLFDAVGRNPAAAAFNADLSQWDTSRAVNFYAMFQGATQFNGDIGQWDVGQARDFSYAFAGAGSFNQDISDWDMRQVNTMLSMFRDAASFNQDISRWRLDSLQTFSSVLEGATNFNQDLCAWNEHFAEDSLAAMDAFTDTACPAADTSIDWTANPPSPLCHVCPPDYACFSNREQLVVAVDEYMIDPAFVADRYGPDMGQWCVGGVTDFLEVLSGDRNQRLRQFNEDISGWDMSAAVSMRSMLQGAEAFNQPLGSWQISSVTNMESFLAGASSFNQDLCAWGELLSPDVDTTNAFANTACPFAEQEVVLTGPYPGPLCTSCAPPTLAPTAPPTPSDGNICFPSGVELAAAVDDYLQEPSGRLTRARYGHPIGSWCVSGVIMFDDLFSAERNPLAAEFDEDISGWDTSSAESFFLIFNGARKFNQDLSGWSTSRVVDFGGMFNNATLFNGDVSSWDLSNAISTSFMFNNCTSFAQDVSGWDVSNVERFTAMFSRAEIFSSDLSLWNVGSGTDFSSMFFSASSFSSDLSRWDVSRATSIRTMFTLALPFGSDADQALSRWDVSRVTNFFGSFAFLPLFNQDLSGWNVSNAEDMGLMFLGSSQFSQDLCPWGSILSPDTVFEDIFADTNCASMQDPNLGANPPGPFCEQCRR